MADGDEAAEANLAWSSHVVSAAVEDSGARQAYEVQLRLARRIAFGQGALPVLAQGAFEELLAAVDVVRGRLVVRAPDAAQATTLAVVGSWPTTPLFDLEPTRTEFGPDRIVTTVRLTGGGAAGAEFEAGGRAPLTREQAFLGEAGMASLGTWLSGVVAAAGGRLEEPVGEASPSSSLKDAIRQVRERLSALAREQQLPPIDLDHELCPNGGTESLSALVGAGPCGCLLRPRPVGPAPFE